MCVCVCVCVCVDVYVCMRAYLCATRCRYAVMGIDGIYIRNITPAAPAVHGKTGRHVRPLSDRSQIQLDVKGLYVQVQCEGMRRVVDFLRIDAVRAEVLLSGKHLTTDVSISPLEVCFSVQHFSALLGLVNNIKEQPQVGGSGQSVGRTNK